HPLSYLYRKRRKLPLLPPPVIIRRGKTTIRRYSGRSVRHMEEVKGKIVECVEFYTSSESHSIDVCFQDNDHAALLHRSRLSPGNRIRRLEDRQLATHQALPHSPLPHPPQPL